MEVPRLEVELELQLPAYATASATATPDMSRVCDLHHHSQQCQILNLLSGARDWTHVLMDTRWVRYHWATVGTPYCLFFWTMRYVSSFPGSEHAGLIISLCHAREKYTIGNWTKRRKRKASGSIPLKVLETKNSDLEIDSCRYCEQPLEIWGTDHTTLDWW